MTYEMAVSTFTGWFDLVITQFLDWYCTIPLQMYNVSATTVLNAMYRANFYPICDRQRVSKLLYVSQTSTNSSE